MASPKTLGHSPKARLVVTMMDVGDLYSRGHPVDQNDLMAPVGLEGFAGIEAERHIGSSRRFPRRLRSTGGIAPHRIVATVITQIA